MLCHLFLKIRILSFFRILSRWIESSHWPESRYHWAKVISLVRRGLTEVIVASRRTVRNKWWVLKRTSHSLLHKSHYRTTVWARMRAKKQLEREKGVDDKIMHLFVIRRWLESCINKEHIYPILHIHLCVYKFAVCTTIIFISYGVCKICINPEWRCWPGVAFASTSAVISA